MGLDEQVRGLISKRVLRTLQDSPGALSAAEIGSRIGVDSRSVAMACRRLEANKKIISLHACKPLKYVDCGEV